MNCLIEEAKGKERKKVSRKKWKNDDREIDLDGKKVDGAEGRKERERERKRRPLSLSVCLS